MTKDIGQFIKDHIIMCGVPKYEQQPIIDADKANKLHLPIIDVEERQRECTPIIEVE